MVKNDKSNNKKGQKREFKIQLMWTKEQIESKKGSKTQLTETTT